MPRRWNRSTVLATVFSIAAVSSVTAYVLWLKFHDPFPVGKSITILPTTVNEPPRGFESPPPMPSADGAHAFAVQVLSDSRPMHDDQAVLKFYGGPNRALLWEASWQTLVKAHEACEQWRTAVEGPMAGQIAICNSPVNPEIVTMVELTQNGSPPRQLTKWNSFPAAPGLTVLILAFP